MRTSARRSARPTSLFALWPAAFPGSSARQAGPADDPGVILFTSGSFGAPRGVVLSQANLLANVAQIAAHIELDPDWVMFNPLPIFHCFGLTGGVMLPLLTGMKAFQYPSPLHVKLIPPLIKDCGASILLATDTFVNQYARAADPDELSGLQFIVCGAEKVREETHNLIAERFGPVPVLEGYGATEASPGDRGEQADGQSPRHGRRPAARHPDPHRIGGRNRARRAAVRARAQRHGRLSGRGRRRRAAPDGWHDTGDVVEITDDGWITILGRVKRFAKIGGEMVSLTAAEDLAAALWPDSRHAVIALPDAQEGRAPGPGHRPPRRRRRAS